MPGNNLFLKAIYLPTGTMVSANSKLSTYSSVGTEENPMFLVRRILGSGDIKCSGDDEMEGVQKIAQGLLYYKFLHHTRCRFFHT